MVDQVFLPVLAKQVELNLTGWGCPLEVVESLGRFDIDPTWSDIHHSLYNFVIVAQIQNILVKLCHVLLVQGKQVVLSLYLSFSLQLLSQLSLFSTWSPDGSRIIVWVFVNSAHPLEASQLLVGVVLVMVLVSLILFFFFFCLCIFAGCVNLAVAASLCRLLSLLHLFAALRCVLLSNFLWGSVAPNVGNSLKLFLLGQLFSFLLLLLQLESFSCCFKLLLVDNKEVTWASFRKVGLGQDVLDTGDWTDIALFVDVLQLMHLVWLVNNAVSLLKVDQFVSLLPLV